jgi:hypothetical protein
VKKRKKRDVPQSATLSFTGFVNIQKLSIRNYDFNKKRVALWGTSPDSFFLVLGDLDLGGAG